MTYNTTTGFNPANMAYPHGWYPVNIENLGYTENHPMAGFYYWSQPMPTLWDGERVFLLIIILFILLIIVGKIGWSPK